MRRVGVYHVPFPYDPYPLQEDAVNKLSHFLREEARPGACEQTPARTSAGEAAEEVEPGTGVKRAREAVTLTDRLTAPPRLAVLESPTGTGKSQMLLNAVLASAFDVVMADDASVAEPAEGPEGNEDQSLGPHDGTAEPAPLSLEAVVAQQRLEDELQRVRHARRQRVRAERRRLRLARQYMTQYLSSEKKHAVSAKDATAESFEFLIEQDPVQFLREHAPGMYNALLSETGGGNDGEDGGRVGLGMISSSSSLDGSSSDDENDRRARRRAQRRGQTSASPQREDEEEVMDDDEAISQHLATLVPLRAPKIFFASRTHTQLDQLRGDFEKTAFAHAPVRARLPTREAVGGDVPQDAPRRLRAVHVASRQQLCVNARVRARVARGGSGPGGEALSEACLEAIRYEYSSAGRAARQRERQQQQQGTVVTVTSFGGLGDMEDAVSAVAGEETSGTTEGCVYCGEKRLRALVEYIQQQQQQQEATHGSHLGGDASVSLEVMRKLGRELQACPYLATRLLVRGADILFIPYGYLVDEAQRESLLRGVATNPVTDAEATQQHEAARAHGYDEAADGGEGSEAVTGRTALGAVLSRRRRVRERAAAPTRQPTSPAEHRAPKSAAAAASRRPDTRDDERRLAALNAGPNFAGSLLVFDEAHNLADHCRTASTAVVSALELRLTSALVQAYLARYEKRLLSTSKQLLRQLRLFLDGLCRGATAALCTTTTAVLPFTAFVFNAGVDHVDAFAFLAFLSDSRLFLKLPGMVSYVLAREQAEAEGLTAVATTTETRVAPRLSTLFAEHLRGAVSPSACTAAALAAVRRVEHVLRWFYLSDDSTRVLLSRKDDEAADTIESTTSSRFALTLVQLHPATHTLRPVLHAARATVLAGGTMQPLQLTCAPLLEAPTTRTLVQASPVRFIQEGHVVPSSSVAVWALGVGPSGARLSFRHQGTGNALSSPPSSLSSSPSGASRGALFGELALTLLNVARVMPPAGLVCFFTSYDLEAQFTAFLHAHAALYWDPLNAIKKVFREGSLRQEASARTKATAPSGVTIEQLMQDYREWIHGCTTSTTGGPSGRRGAILFAVMGGRLSEGINFADDLGRCVMVVGMPFANPSDPELRLHLRHLASAASVTVSAHIVADHPDSVPAEKMVRTEEPADPSMDGPSSPEVCRLDAPFSASEWSLYTDMCMRVVNQSIGRCIRHAADYATVILLDERYVTRQDVRQRISAWLQPSITVATGGFPQCIRGIKQFFDARVSASPSCT